MTGMTVHDLTNQLDAGDVVHQCAADLISGDTIHMLGARAVQKLSEELPILINLFSKKGSFEKKQHNTNGMLWLANRWKPEHLKQIYIQNNDQIVDLYLNGKLSQKPPQLFRQF
ncbi:MAG: hypothetical protein P8H03_04080 [Emcibacteraceae bacterium]|nr:hypothetical protein [Emcibacteraceae bacterium]